MNYETVPKTLEAYNNKEITYLEYMEHCYNIIDSLPRARATLTSDELEVVRPKIEWYKPSEKLPENNEECILLGVLLYGPITWKDNGDEKSFWFDSLPGDGNNVIIKISQVKLWARWNDIKPSY